MKQEPLRTLAHRTRFVFDTPANDLVKPLLLQVNLKMRKMKRRQIHYYLFIKIAFDRTTRKRHSPVSR